MVVHVHLDRVGAFLEACFHWCTLSLEDITPESDSCKMKKPHGEFHSRMVKCQSMIDGFGYEMLMGGIRYRFMSCHVAWFHGCMNRHRPGG